MVYPPDGVRHTCLPLPVSPGTPVGSSGYGETAPGETGPMETGRRKQVSRNKSAKTGAGKTVPSTKGNQTGETRLRGNQPRGNRTGKNRTLTCFVFFFGEYENPSLTHLPLPHESSLFSRKCIQINAICTNRKSIQRPRKFPATNR